MTNVFHTLIARFLQIPEGQVERTIGLLNEGATIPFISRYRKEVTGRILNECMNSGMPKTAWCRANGISEKLFFYWQRILRREAYEASQNPSLPAVTETGQLSAVQQSVSFAEIKLPAVPSDASSVFHPDLVIRKGKLVLEISNSASAELLSRIGGILHAE